jgi:hypothetical protein
MLGWSDTSEDKGKREGRSSTPDSPAHSLLRHAIALGISGIVAAVGAANVNAYKLSVDGEVEEGGSQQVFAIAVAGAVFSLVGSSKARLPIQLIIAAVLGITVIILQVDFP